MTYRQNAVFHDVLSRIEHGIKAIGTAIFICVNGFDIGREIIFTKRAFVIPNTAEHQVVRFLIQAVLAVWGGFITAWTALLAFTLFHQTAYQIAILFFKRL